MILENEYLIVDISKKGAELKSIRSKSNNHEYLWSGDSAYWGKTSPVLFPVVGALKDNTYFYQGKAYQLPRHGFARDLEFEEERLSGTEASFSLNDTPKTTESYPFRFELKIRYRLKGHGLSSTYEVYNPDNKNPLLFSIGGHPAFAVAEKDHSVSYEQHYLEFPDDNELRCYELEGNLLSDEVTVIPLKDGRLPLRYELFYKDALVMKDLKSEEIFLKNDVNDRAIRFRYHDFPFFGIWAAKDADFVCLEPWCGIADNSRHDQQLIRKEGIQTLQPGKSWSRSWEIRCW